MGLGDGQAFSLRGTAGSGGEKPGHNKGKQRLQMMEMTATGAASHPPNVLGAKAKNPAPADSWC